MDWDAASRYRLLLKINNAIVRETGRDSLFKAVSRELHEVIPFDRFSINLYAEETGSLSYFAAAQGVLAGELEATVRPIAKGAIANAVIRSKKPLIIPDLAAYDYWESARNLVDAGLKATMAFPLIVRDKVIGTLHFSFRKVPDDMENLADFILELANQVAIAVDNMLAYTRLQVENKNLESQNKFLLAENYAMYSHENFFFASQRMNDIMLQAKLIAETDASVLITGETGTGKDQVAHFIHNMSSRHNRLFVKVNCPALTPTLFESELFGHAKGAFTGADRQRIGRFEMAQGGTVFLDEIGELPLTLQAKLLHVLQDKTFERVGDSKSIAINFRVIAATNRNLEESIITGGTFRSDLFYRLNTISISLPPLRERTEDIPLLVERLNEVHALETHRPAPRFSISALESMRHYRWPGNIRELKNFLKRLFILRPGELITDLDVKSILHGAGDLNCGAAATLDENEKLHIQRTLEQTKGQVSGARGAAALLGVPRTTLQYRLKKHDINPEDFRRP